ncbi:hypothetical protein CDL15_Pgr010375 [Punica granatum]|uniref:Mitochondrial uncoupling protein 1-like n=1 Tax=Punica granatum TaxID=22663 RepID=A0A218W1K4_PUNGR|nr:hypothetical protein CDL15_Pgr010375 [Punica granatum]
MYLWAQFCTIPLDAAKVRLQLQKKAPASEGSPKYRGLLGTVATIAREEGLSALWSGIIPGLHRQCIYGGLRIGLYGPVKSFLGGSDLAEDTSLFQKVLAALLTGAVAIVVANPTDLVKVRLQAEGKLPAGVPGRYSGALNAYATIAKQTILKIPGFVDNVLTQILAGLGAGFFAVCIGSPIDVVKSRMMGDSTYRSTLECFMKTWKHEGIFAFYKGFLPNFGRLGSWNVVMFLTFEQAKKFLTGAA